MDTLLSRTDTGQARWWNAETFAVPICSPARSWSSRSSSTKTTERKKKKLRRQGGLAETRENPSGPGELAKVPCPLAPRCQGEEEAMRRGWRRCQTPWAAGEVGPPAPATAGYGKEEKVMDVEEDEDVAAEEQELDSVEEVGRLTIGDRL